MTNLLGVVLRVHSSWSSQSWRGPRGAFSFGLINRLGMHACSLSERRRDRSAFHDGDLPQQGHRFPVVQTLKFTPTPDRGGDNRAVQHIPERSNHEVLDISS